jgi:hypothetical protein
MIIENSISNISISRTLVFMMSNEPKDLSVSSNDVPTEAGPNLSLEAFQSEESRQLFEAIDKLRGLDIAHQIGFPQVIYYYFYKIIAQ